MAVILDRQKGDHMKETVYRCNKCRQIIKDTRHKITARDGTGKETKYGALLEDIDLCENCMASTALAILDIIGDQDEETDSDDDSEDDAEKSQAGQQDMEDDMRGASERQQEGQEHVLEDTKTYQCSKAIKTCRYGEKVGTAWCCNYIGIAKHRRGCEPEQCDKYEKIVRKRGRKRKTPEGE